MPQIAAFRGLRYDLGHVGSLEHVVAPPYDVIDRDLQDALLTKHPANVIRLILNRDEPGDDADAKYARAARYLRNWQQEGVLQREPDPALYVYHQVFDFGGRTYTRRGFVCRTRLERFGEGTIYPHEETHASAKADRLKLTRACKANLSQVFGIYPDPENEAQNILEAAIQGVTPVEAKDHLGVIHRLWAVSDLQVINNVASVMAAKPTYIADGHHRYETACNYRDELGGDALDPQHAANYVMMMCVGMDDPGMIVLPTHRLFRGVPAMNSEQLKAKLNGHFDVRVAGEGGDLADTIWQQIETEGDQGTIGFYCEPDNRWLVASITDSGREQVAAIAPEHSSDWHSLGVSVLHRLIMQTILGHEELAKPEYVHRVDEVIDGIERGDVEANGERFQLAALVMPATLDHIRAISEHGERMPAKSTYFYPKLLSGLVINPHDA
jgi:uncharacterized protein (DUF1015 family)